MPTALAKQNPVERAWQSATASGKFNFTSSIEQTTTPLPKLINAGLTPTTEFLYVEGSAETHTDSLTLSLYSQGGSPSFNSGGIDIKVVDGMAVGRVNGSAWEPIDDITSFFAPNQDPLAFLSAAKDFTYAGQAKTATNITYERYQFAVDGVKFAQFMRDQTAAELDRRGQLPAGIPLGASRQLAELGGTGEIWLDADGMPLRQIVNLSFPPTELEQVSAEITTDFSQWGDVSAQQSTLLWLADLGDKIKATKVDATVEVGSVLAVAALALMLIVHSEKRRVYQTVAYGYAGLFFITPVLQTGQMLAMTDAIHQFEASHGLVEEEPEDARQNFAPPAVFNDDAEETPNETFFDDGTDTDGDGLTDIVEVEFLGTLENSADTDNDGLDDGVEVLELGLDPLRADTDNDLLSDKAEVKGYFDGTQLWNTDPRNPDSSGDGSADSFDCTETAGTLTCVDTDNDDIPDLFDLDDDNDGVPDDQDNDPDTFVGSPTLGMTNQTLTFDLNGLNAGETTFADFQLRPTSADHLWYSLSILDWPTNDRGGQVTRVNDDAFGTSGRDANGDMKLIPLLELEMGGTNTPLPLTEPETTVTFGSVLTGSVTLSQNGADTQFDFDLPADGTYSASVYDVTCAQANTGEFAPSATFTSLTATDSATWANQSLASDIAVGGRALFVAEPATEKVVCRNIRNIVNGAYVDQMLDTDALQVYGITARETDSNGFYLYVPLTLVYDEKANMPVAFAGRMLYDPLTNLNAAQQTARLMWMVNTKTERCSDVPTTFDPDPSTTGDDDESDDEKAKAWCADPANWLSNGATTVHAYYDDWYLTGMSVKRNKDYQTAAIFQDPSYTSTQTGWSQGGFGDGALWMLSRGLDVSFVAGRTDAGMRDMTVDMVQSRFDQRINGGVSDEDRFQLPSDAFFVERFDYRDSTSLGTLAQTETYQILHDTFTPQVNAGVIDTTILYLQEDTFRVQSLAEANTSRANSVSFDLTTVPEVTLATMNWASYRWAVDGWEPYPQDEYWEIKGAAIEADLQNVLDAANAEGAALLNKIYYQALAVGLSGYVETDGVANSAESAINDSEITPYLYSSVDYELSLGKALVNAADQSLFLLQAIAGSNVIVGNVGGLIKPSDFGISYYERISQDFGYDVLLSPGGQTLMRNAELRVAQINGLGIAAGVLSVVNTTISIIAGFVGLGDTASAKVLSFITKSLSIIIKTISLAGTIIKVTAQLALDTVKTLVKTLKFAKAGIIFTIIFVAVDIGFFIYEAVSAELGAFSPAFNEQFAQLIASIVVTVLLFVISSIPVIGQLIVAVLYLIDALIALLCAAIPEVDPEEATQEQVERDTKARDYICGGLTGLLTKVLSWFFYDNAPLVEIDRDDRLNITNIDFELVNPADGFQAGNRLRVFADVETVLYPNNIDNIEEFSYFSGYRWMFNDNGYQRTTLEYAFTETDENDDVHKDVELDGQTWEPISTAPDDFFAAEDARFYRIENLSYTMSAALEAQISRDQSATLPLFLQEAQAYPLQECTIPYICWIRKDGSTMHLDMGSLTNFDIFPATIDEFRALQTATPSGASYRLGWSALFPPLKDADGDGLRSVDVGGVDPNDLLPDSDFDGLTDYYELQVANSDPLVRDTDNDGLCDGQELDFGTSPTRADTDGDGLLDGEEVYHLDLCDGDNDGNVDEWIGGWSFIYDFNGVTPLETWVTSDPLSADADGDLYSDAFEKLYNFNPRVASTGDIINVSAETSTPYVKPGDTIDYSVEIENGLRQSFALGLMDVEFNAEISAETLVPLPYNLAPQETETINGQVTVDSNLTQSQIVSMTNTTDSIIINPLDAVDGRSLWLKLDDTPPLVGNVRTFDDSSLNDHSIICLQGVCPQLGADGYLADSVRFSNTNYLVSDGVTVQDLGIAKNGFTIDLWLKPTGSLDMPLVQMGNLQLDVIGNGLFVRDLPNFNLISGQNVTSDVWQQITWTYKDGQSALYIDGVQTASGATDFETALDNAANQPIYFGDFNDPAGTGQASIDEISIYPFALQASQVAVQNQGRVFYLRGNTDVSTGTTGTDDSNFANPVTCYDFNDGDCPNIDNNGFADTGYELNSQTFGDYYIFEVGPAPNLNLGRNNAFTMAAWVQYSSGGDGTSWVLGRGDPSDPSAKYEFPSFRASAYEASGENGREIVISFAGGLKGADGRTCTFDVTAFILESDPRFELFDLNGNGGWAHFTIVYDGVGFVPYVNNMRFDVEHRVNNVVKSNCDGVDLVSADNFTFGGAGTIDTSGTPFFDGKPFDGFLDEVQIFNYAMRAEQVADVYWDDTPILDLRLDEPPTSETFVDRSLNAYTVTCDGASCPLAGLPGRDNQAIRFDGIDDHLNLPTVSELDMLDSDFTLAGWFALENISFGSLFKTAGANTLFLGSGGGTNGQGIPLAIAGNKILEGLTPLSANEWTHLALRYRHNGGSESTATLFVDGVAVDTATDVNLMLNGATQLLSGVYLNEPTLPPSTGLFDRLQIFRTALTNAEVAELIDQTPFLSLHLNEALGATPVDTANAYPDVFCAHCKLGVDGRMNGAMTDSYLEVTPIVGGESVFNMEQFSIGVWVRPTQKKSNWQPIFVRENTGNSDRNYGLHIIPNSMQVNATVMLDDCTTFAGFGSNADLLENAWNHVLMTYDGENLRLFINGSLDNSVSVASVCAENAVLSLGDGPNSARMSGDLDEFVLYRSVLSPEAIRDIYDYQLAWYDADTETRIVVDADKPTVEFDAPSGYLALEDRIMAIVARDETSPIDSVEVRIDSGSWTDATADGEAWLFTFSPTSTDDYTIRTRVTDAAGNVRVTVYDPVSVDGTPPVLETINVEGMAVVPTNFETENLTWSVDLAGGILVTGASVDRAQVRIFDPEGVPVSDWLTPTLTANSWSMAYPFEIRPNGYHTIHVQVWDEVGNFAERIATAAIDGTAPATTLDVVGGSDFNIGIGTLVTGAATDEGEVSSGVASVEVSLHSEDVVAESGAAYVVDSLVAHFTLDEVVDPSTRNSVHFEDSSASGLTATCITCPATGEGGKLASAPQFDGVDDAATVNLGTALSGGAFSFSTWVKPTSGGGEAAFLTIVDGSTNYALRYNTATEQFRLRYAGVSHTTSNLFAADEWHHVLVVADPLVGGRLYVNGVQQLVFSVPSVPGNGSVLDIGRNATTNFAGQIDDVTVYDRDLLAIEVRALQRTGKPTLHLRFDERGSVSDSSANGWAIAQNTLPTDPIAGAVGATAQLMTAGNSLKTAGESLGQNDGFFTQMAWVYPEAGGKIFGSTATATPIYRLPFWNLVGTTKLEVGFGTGSQVVSFTSGDILTANAWNFVATTFDGITYRFYVDGEFVASTTAFSGETPSFSGGQLEIGGFTGRLDEVVFVQQTVSRESIRKAFAKGWQPATITSRADWQYTIPTVPLTAYELRLRTTDTSGNVSYDYRELPRWSGEIDNSVPAAVTLVEMDTTSTMPVVVLWFVVVLAIGTCVVIRPKRQS